MTRSDLRCANMVCCCPSCQEEKFDDCPNRAKNNSCQFRNYTVQIIPSDKYYTDTELIQYVGRLKKDGLILNLDKRNLSKDGARKEQIVRLKEYLLAKGIRSPIT